MNTSIPRNLALACACWMATQSSRAWDCTGHMLVAQVARARMSSQAVARVDALAATLSRNGAPYNGVSIACWADDIKDKSFQSPFQGHFRPWHYIDIGCSTNDPDALAHSAMLTTNAGNVVLALNHCLAILKTKKTSDLVPNEAVALALLVHFVGDIHQPLHCASRYNPDPKPTDKYTNDAGGNGISLANLADTPWSKNLHTFWDEAYRRYYENGEVRARSEIPETAALGSPEMQDWMARLKPFAPPHPDLEVDFKKWAMQTHNIACADVYGKLGAPYGARDVKLTDQYVAQAEEIARRQIVLAGYRLAAILNDIYGQ